MTFHSKSPGKVISYFYRFVVLGKSVSLEFCSIRYFCFVVGNLSQRHREIFHRNPLFLGMRLPEVKDFDPLERRYPKITPTALDLIKVSLYYWCNDLTQWELIHRDLDPVCSADQFDCSQWQVICFSDFHFHHLKLIAYIVVRMRVSIFIQQWLLYILKLMWNRLFMPFMVLIITLLTR